MTSKEAMQLAVEAMDSKMAEDIRVIDISSVSILADYFIIATGTNRTQIQTIADETCEKLGRTGMPAKSIEGYEGANWILLDFGDIIVHVFDKENRLFYDLERIWRDGKEIDIKKAGE